MATTLEATGDATAATDAAARLERAFVLMVQGRADLAEGEVRRALAADPSAPRAHAYLAHCLAARGRHDEAQAEAEAAVRLDPESAFAHSMLAHVHLARDRPAEALAAATAAVRLAPGAADYRAKLAEVHFAQDRPVESLAAAEAGLALDPEHAPCGHVRALALLRLGRPAEAAESARLMLGRDADDPIAHMVRGLALLDLRDREVAEEHLRIALRLDPGLGLAQKGLGAALRARYAGYRLPTLAKQRRVPDRELPWWKRGEVRWAAFWAALLFAPWVIFKLARGGWRLAADTVAVLRLRRGTLGRHLLAPDRPGAATGVVASGLVALAGLVTAVASGTNALWAAPLWAAVWVAFVLIFLRNET